MVFVFCNHFVSFLKVFVIVFMILFVPCLYFSWVDEMASEAGAKAEPGKEYLAHNGSSSSSSDCKKAAQSLELTDPLPIASRPLQPVAVAAF